MRNTSRRQFIVATGAAGVSAIIAGCSNGTGGDNGSENNGSDSGTTAGSDGNTSDNETANDETVGGGTTSGGEMTTGGETTTAGETADGMETTSTETANTGTTDGGGGTTVASGPNGKLIFEPKQIEVSVGDTVTWAFKSPGHNVSAKPEDNEKISIPDGAVPFASYEDHNTYAVVDEGETYEYTFETPGKYTYVCIPHASSGMVGTVTVSK